jgi:hypothetical protein
LDALRNTYHELFEEHGVDIVLQANVHNYERTYPLEFSEQYSDETPDVPIETSLEQHTYDDPEGQIFVTVGTGGKSIHEFQSKYPYIVTQFEDFGFLDIAITDGGKRLTGTFYENDNGGAIQDQFTVTKEGADVDEEEEDEEEEEEEDDDLGAVLGEDVLSSRVQDALARVLERVR